MKIIVFGIILLLINQQLVFAESDKMMITISDTMEEINFDGRWSFFTEWKQSVFFESSDKSKILRVAHYGDYIYVLIEDLSNFIGDDKIDYATICIDGKNEKSEKFDGNDYCFRAQVDNEGFVFQYDLETDKKTVLNSNLNNFIAIGGISNSEDRYSQIEHSSYEFKIPIELFGRESTYGFYFNTFNSEEQEIYQWPETLDKLNYDTIPSPSTWGELISPDKSLPEFSMPMLLISLVLPMTAMFALTRMKFLGKMFKK